MGNSISHRQKDRDNKKDKVDREKAVDEKMERRIEKHTNQI